MKKDYYLLDANEYEETCTSESKKMKFLDNLFDNEGEFHTSHTTLEKDISGVYGADTIGKIKSDLREEKIEDFTKFLVGVFVISIFIFLCFFTFKWSLIASLVFAVILVGIRQYYIYCNYYKISRTDNQLVKNNQLESHSGDYELIDI